MSEFSMAVTAAAILGAFALGLYLAGQAATRTDRMLAVLSRRVDLQGRDVKRLVSAVVNLHEAIALGRQADRLEWRRLNQRVRQRLFIARMGCETLAEAVARVKAYRRAIARLESGYPCVRASAATRDDHAAP